MTPKEQGKLIVDEFYKLKSNSASELTYHFAIQSALIAVDYLIHVTPSINSRPPNYQDVNKFCSEYWQQVRNEILSLKSNVKKNIPEPPKDRVFKESGLFEF